MSINSEMTALADAIRDKSGVTGKLSISGMTTAVSNISVGGGESGDIDLSFITATAGDILSGKVGSDTDGNPVYGTLEISGGGDIDLSGVTVTADKMLSGIVAVGADGNKVTGNIATVTPSVNKNTFTVGKGYVAEAFSQTIPESGASVIEANKVTVPAGFLSADRVETIAEATVTETDSSVTITPGYVAEELNYELGSGGGGSADVTYGYINADGMFQPLDLSGETPVEVGEPEAVDEIGVFATSSMFCINAKEDGTTVSIGVYSPLWYGNHNLFARKNKGEWEQIVFTSDNDTSNEFTHFSQNFELNYGDSLEIFNTSGTLSNEHDNYRFIINKDVSFSGDIYSLINFQPLTERCFYALFLETPITVAPKLMATTLANSCYDKMFANCHNLREVHVGFTSFGDNAYEYTDEWLANVAETGVFYKPKELIVDSRGDSGVPPLWQEVDIEE